MFLPYYVRTFVRSYVILPLYLYGVLFSLPNLSFCSEVQDPVEHSITVDVGNGAKSQVQLSLEVCEPNQSHTIAIEFLNSSDQAVNIEHIEKSCGCMNELPNTVSLAPLERKHFKVNLRAPVIPGNFSVGFTCHDKERLKQIRVLIEGLTKLPYELNPVRVSLVNEEQFELTIARSLSRYPELTLLRVECISDIVELTHFDAKAGRLHFKKSKDVRPIERSAVELRMYRGQQFVTALSFEILYPERVFARPSALVLSQRSEVDVRASFLLTGKMPMDKSLDARLVKSGQKLDMVCSVEELRVGESAARLTVVIKGPFSIDEGTVLSLSDVNGWNLSIPVLFDR